jgi:CII-binding regulator of phage lambda lysogenization HflD
MATTQRQTFASLAFLFKNTVSLLGNKYLVKKHQSYLRSPF